MPILVFSDATGGAAFIKCDNAIAWAESEKRESSTSREL